MTRVKVASFTTADIDYLKEYAQVMGPVAKALDKLQGEDLAYLGCLLPTLAVTIIRLTSTKDTRLTYCKPLVEAMLEGIHRRFGQLLEDRDCQLAAGFHPRFRLNWLQAYNAELVPRVTSAMEEAVERAMRKEAEVPSTSETSEEDEGDDFYTTIAPCKGSSRERNFKTKAHRMVSGWLENDPRYLL
jgi:hypothetical protein